MRSHQVSSQLFIDSNFYSDFYNDLSGDFHAEPHHGLDGEFSAEMIHSTPPSDLLTSSDQEYGLGFPFKDSFFDQVSTCSTINQCFQDFDLSQSLTHIFNQSQRLPVATKFFFIIFFVSVRNGIYILEFMFLNQFLVSLFYSFSIKLDVNDIVFVIYHHISCITVNAG